MHPHAHTAHKGLPTHMRTHATLANVAPRACTLAGRNDGDAVFDAGADKEVAREGEPFDQRHAHPVRELRRRGLHVTWGPGERWGGGHVEEGRDSCKYTSVGEAGGAVCAAASLDLCPIPVSESESATIAGPSATLGAVDRDEVRAVALRRLCGGADQRRQFVRPTCPEETRPPIITSRLDARSRQRRRPEARTWESGGREAWKQPSKGRPGRPSQGATGPRTA